MQKKYPCYVLLILIFVGILADTSKALADNDSQPIVLSQDAGNSTDISNTNYNAKLRSPGMAWFLSFLIPGLGDLYNAPVVRSQIGAFVGFTSIYATGFLLVHFGNKEKCKVVFREYTPTGTSIRTECTRNLGQRAFGLGFIGLSWVSSMVNAPTTAVKINSRIYPVEKIGKRFQSRYIPESSKFEIFPEIEDLGKTKTALRISLAYKF